MFPKDHVFILNQNQNQYFLFLLLPIFLKKNRSGEISSISNIATDSFKVVFDLVHLVEFPSGLNQWMNECISFVIPNCQNIVFIILDYMWCVVYDFGRLRLTYLWPP